MEQTRSESGCISFDVRRTVNPLVWQVDEKFIDAGSFDAHQKRASLSEWGRATAGIERRYTIEGIGADVVRPPLQTQLDRARPGGVT
ncbi:putative quinol monooxygenase [Saxibacter everestensis]|uniref:putative quinol monooxygenase n=1 Tax=Saxibacter everestensis TaxID=2909229 RepID=UPI0032E35980